MEGGAAEGDRVTAGDRNGRLNGGRSILGGGQPGGPGKHHRRKTRILVSSNLRSTGGKYITGAAHCQTTSWKGTKKRAFEYTALTPTTWG
jgi:hypothetical protein